jgi:hypothetical protein
VAPLGLPQSEASRLGTLLQRVQAITAEQAEAELGEAAAEEDRPPRALGMGGGAAADEGWEDLGGADVVAMHD